MKRTMLVATDFDEYAPRLMDFCAGTWERGIYRAILVNVVDTSGLEGPMIPQVMEDAKNKLNVLATPIREAGIETSVRIVTGSPAYEILSIAHDEGVNVIVMGTTAKSAVSRFFTGSISEEIATGQKAPTLLIRNDLLDAYGDVEKASLRWSHKIIVPVDYSAASARAVLQCTRFEPESVGEVRLVHVLDEKYKSDDMHALIAEQEFRLSAFSRMLEDIGIKAVPVVRCGKVKEELLAEIEESQATGAVMGASSKKMLTEIFVGSTTQAIVRESSVFVMVVP